MTAKTPAKYTNHLAGQTSPYLLQHADNPVDWYPWGPEAFELARKQDKPVFLSIGYSTCHWCHVMEHESFENERIAGILNRHFVCIKVDREQRPDIDAVYMNAVQIMTGSGGWPLSAFLTPQGRPFYGGTYFPPKDRYGRPGFERVLLAIADAWKNKRSELLASAAAVGQALEGMDSGAQKRPLSSEVFETARAQLESIFDAANGGFGTAPKFPQASNLSFLLRYWRRTGDAGALAMVKATLDAMADGGIRDHLGGGFHRYSTDAAWLVPHFEKMLYDQALLARVYVQAYQAVKDDRYGRIATDTYDYVLRRMTDPAGGFYAAEDADSQGREGAFYVWSPDEVRGILGARNAEIFNAYYGVTGGGNFEHGRSILHISRPLEAVASRLKLGPEAVRQTLAGARPKLLDARSKRPRPHRDDKVITGWNGLMISSLAYGGTVLGRPRYIEAAAKAGEFLLSDFCEGGRLKRYYRRGQAVGTAFLDDYAFMILGLMDLYEATFEARWLVQAKALAGQMVELFGDGKTGAFYLAPRDGERLILRARPAYDGALPSANSAAALALARLGLTTMDQDLTDRADRLLDAFSGRIVDSPLSLTAMLAALDTRIGPAQEVVIAGQRRRGETHQMLKVVRRDFAPNTVVLLHQPGPAGKDLERIVPFIQGQEPLGGKVTAYVCRDYVCRKPVTEADTLEKMLDELNTLDREGP